MNFINRMKKREFLEMGIMALIAFLVAFIAIILMEGMIYGIELKALKTKGNQSISNSASTVAYCIKEDEDKYFVVFHNDSSATEGATEWTAVADDYKTKAECESLSVKEIVWHAPNAFEFSITPVHYVVMGVFVALVAGFFVYRFIMLDKNCKKTIKQFEETGTIEL